MMSLVSFCFILPLLIIIIYIAGDRAMNLFHLLYVVIKLILLITIIVGILQHHKIMGHNRHVAYSC